ncbi:uncharacterized protein LOC127002346 isoform X8 [Eriocheir sinensis]|uniref:uncharacterized protein LOC127002346 isoform X8 n=1 Tax=Eriocheir sinensis TaxID=95602 RepID=UPI0021C67AF0|nr:uncharacterized protein LOC127002346 isoform X8 [Eriocheir sinensis]
MYRRILWYYGRKVQLYQILETSHVQQCLKRICTVEFCGTMVEKFNTSSTVPNSRDLSHVQQCLKRICTVECCGTMDKKFNTPSTVPNSRDLSHVQQCLKRKCTVEFCGTMVEKFNTSSTVPNSIDLSHVQLCLKRICTVEFCGTMVEKFNTFSTVQISIDLSCSAVFKKEMYRRILWYYGRKFNTPSTVPNSKDLLHVQQCLKRKCTVEFCGTMVEKFNTSSTVPNSKDLSCSPVFKKEMYRRILWYYGRKFNTSSTVPNSKDLSHVQQCLKRKCTVECCGTMVEKFNTSSTVPNSIDLTCSAVFKKEMYRRILWYYGRKFNTPSTVPNSIDHSLQCLTVLQKEMYHSQAYVVCLGGAEPLHSSATSPQTHHSLVSDLHYLKLLLNIIYILNKALNVSLFKIIEMDSIFF